jgi:hypothetical protein
MTQTDFGNRVAKATAEYLKTPVGTLRVIMRNMSAEIEVPSSTPGQSYIVSVTSSFVTCTCPGHHYRGTCKHATMIRKTLGA